MRVDAALMLLSGSFFGDPLVTSRAGSNLNLDDLPSSADSDIVASDSPNLVSWDSEPGQSPKQCWLANRQRAAC